MGGGNFDGDAQGERGGSADQLIAQNACLTRFRHTRVNLVCRDGLLGPFKVASKLLAPGAYQGRQEGMS